MKGVVVIDNDVSFHSFCPAFYRLLIVTPAHWNSKNPNRRFGNTGPEANEDDRAIATGCFYACIT